jgi:hypothetical protein
MLHCPTARREFVDRQLGQSARRTTGAEPFPKPTHQLRSHRQHLEPTRRALAARNTQSGGGGGTRSSLSVVYTVQRLPIPLAAKTTTHAALWLQ